MTSVEANFDGLVGPTHHYAGLSDGNVASIANRGTPANPRLAALEGLEKMRQVAQWGAPQAVLPPHERPHLSTLRRLGFKGSNADVLVQASRQPRLMSAVSSASAMWVANAATVSASADVLDGRVHFTPANLISKFHRALEADHTAQVLRRVFGPERSFCHHATLPGWDGLSDEGAANFMRFAGSPTDVGVEAFVYGRSAFSKGLEPQKFVARQTREASEAIARAHGVRRAVFLQQNPAAIDAGVFHNDVIAVSHERLLFAHEDAFVDGPAALAFLRQSFPALEVEEVPSARVSLQDAVTSYLFNSQILTVDGRRVLFAAQEVAENPSTRAYVDDCHDRGVFDEVRFAGLRQSMKNGGGPACLRLRVDLTDEQRADVHPGVWLTDGLYRQLKAWVERHYRDRLVVDDLADPEFLDEVYTALDALCEILALPHLYPFQRGAE
ncbi:MAG: N-succinylarginine dihydrolase [bacterium]